METKNTQDAPLGILLIATFWIFVGIWFFLIMSNFRSYDLFMFIFLLIGTFFIFLGWGLLSLKRWAWTASLVISIIGLISQIFSFPFSIFALLFGGLFGLILILGLPIFISIIWYLMKIKNIFPKKQGKYCFLCGRNIPSDARICPYCAKKLEELEAEKKTS